MKRLEIMRSDQGMTLEEAADMLGISSEQYRNYEEGGVSVPASVLVALSRLYATSVDYLLGLSDDPAPYL